MILRSSPPSPFGRKVKIAAAILGLSDKIEIVVTDTIDPADSIRQQNPLGKIPALILADGTALYDSRVIVEYLDLMAGGGKLIPNGAERIQTLTLQALADGIMDAGILQMYERRFRDEDRREAKWIAHQQGKIDRALAYLEQTGAPLHTTPLIGEIALACALGYLDLRFEGTWRAKHPKLVAWLDRFAAAVPSFEKTRVTA
ncbi:glutathione S-transferase [Rhizobiales bacterium TNE-4]|nr:glutathione S-transferase [Rhizobiales bacterium TNE-4]MBV1827763.1 glutathione S-transferase [Rhizobiales bacterium TNE-4]